MTVETEGRCQQKRLLAHTMPLSLELLNKDAG